MFRTFITSFVHKPLLASLLLFSTQAIAIDYDVEIIVFEHARNTQTGSSDSLLLPIAPNPVSIPTEPAPGSVIQPLPELRLVSEVEKIRTSDNHRLMFHGGWRQGPLDQENAPFVTIALGRGFEMLAEPADDESTYVRAYQNPPLNINIPLERRRATKLFGAVQVWVGRFLHFDTRLSYTPTGADYSFAFESERRMRSRQLHYIDHGRVGILVKIFPVDDTAPN